MKGHRKVLLIGAVLVGCAGGVAAIASPPSPEAGGPVPAAPEMSMTQAAVLGVIEGLTEYLPVSSTGHLILAQRAMGIENSEAANAYAICIQLGAIVAVLGLYLGRIRQMGLGLIDRNEEGRRLLVNIVVAFLPAAVLGLLLDETIQEHLFGLWPIVAAWFVGGVVILAVAWWRKAHGEGPRYGRALDQLTWRMALVIGLAQCVAMWPGTSRSLMTIVGGVVIGLSLPAAVEFSFLLGVVTLGAATAYKALQLGPEMLEAYGAINLLVGFLTATISAVAAVQWMVAYLQRHGLAVFGYYRVALAVGVAIFLILQ